VDPALWELLRAETGANGDRVLEAVIRLARPGIEIPDVRIVSRFGTIVTCRIRARDVVPVRARPDVISIKAARGLSPEFEPSPGPLDSPRSALPPIRPADVRRSPALTLTGAGVVVAAVDWGVDVDSAALRWPIDPVAADGHRPGGTRLLSFWDQRDQAVGPRPEPYGYGSVHDRDEIDRALQDLRPYERLGYHPAVADLKANGTHGTRICDIAAGNGQAGGPAGIAPEADLIFVHLADRNTSGLAPFGDSVRLLEAVDYISRAAGSQPCVINISAGRTCGPRNGTAIAELAFDELLAATPGRFIVNSAGNYRRWRTHSCGTIAQGETRSLTVVVDPADVTLNEVELWYDGADEFAVRIDPPGYTGGRPVCLGERSDLLIEGRVIGRVYHRKHDPNNGDNHIVAYLDPIGLAGNWTVTLEARRVHSGLFHAWIERDDSCPGCQARFTPDDSNRATTVGSIATSHLPLIVGAYNGHHPARPAASFSSCGPTRDYRLKPDLVAPGVGVLAARSAPIGASRNPGALVRGSGTSYATPHVTGAVALCFQAAGNRLSARQIRSLLLGSCDPVPDSDPYRFGRGYLNIPRLVADVQRTLREPATAPPRKEPTMDSEDAIVLLAAAPSTIYREYLYRPGGQLARWIGGQFEVVARPSQPISQALREGDVLLEVTLGRIGPGRCVTLAARDLELLSSRLRLPHGQLVLRPLKRVEMTEPLPVEPTVDTQDIDLDRPVDQDLPDYQDTGALAGSMPEKDLAADLRLADVTAISTINSDGAGEAGSMIPAVGGSNSGSEAVITAPPIDAHTADAELFEPGLLLRATIPVDTASAGAAGEAVSYLSAPTGAEHAAQPGGPAVGRTGETVLQEASIAPVPADIGIAYESTEAGWRPWMDLILHQVPRSIVADLAKRHISIPPLKDAYGDISLDYYAVKISRMPFLHGSQLTPEALLSHIRRNFNSFVDTNNSSFPPLNNSLDKPRWESDHPLGAVINIQIHALPFIIDQGLVVCSRAEPRLWVFTTAYGGPGSSPKPAWGHPVTGNRMFGISADGNEWILFTRGADRATQPFDWTVNILNLIWRGADALWHSFQARVKDFICANQGSAVIINTKPKRCPWEPIQKELSSALGEEVSPQREKEPDRLGQPGQDEIPDVQNGAGAAGTPVMPAHADAGTSEMSPAATVALPGIEYLANVLQNHVDDVTKRAKRQPNATTRKGSVLTGEDIVFLDFLYTTISQAGRAVAPEAAQLMRRYLDVDGVGIEVVNSGIYERSGAVQAETARHKAEILTAVRRGKLPSDGKTHYDIFANARRTESCEHAQNIPRPPRQRMVTADDERLKKANNRFWIQSYSTRSDNTISTMYVVTDCYEFEPFHKGLYTELQLLGQKLRLEDGLSEYLTRIGLAKVFTYESAWTETWQVSK
jgi:subtilisin family serine protease